MNSLCPDTLKPNEGLIMHIGAENCQNLKPYLDKKCMITEKFKTDMPPKSYP